MKRCVKFSYVFDEDINRVYKCFTDYNLVSGMTYNHVMQSTRRIKGETFDEEGAEFQFIWKNYYTLDIIVENVIKTEAHRGYTHRVIKNDQMPDFTFAIQYNFYWNSCDKQTILTYDYLYDDQFFDQLIENEVSNEEKVTICHNVEKYLKKTTVGLEQSEGAVIDGPILNVWEFIYDWSKLFELCSKIVKIKAVYNGDCQLLGTECSLYTENNVFFGALVIKNILMSEDKMEMYFESTNVPSILPKQTVCVQLIKISPKACYLSVAHNSFEYVSSDALGVISKFKKKLLKFIKDHFASLKQQTVDPAGKPKL